MSQPVVTDYFTKRRRRACSMQAAKRLKVSDSLSPEKKQSMTAIGEIRQVKKSTQSTMAKRTRVSRLNTENVPENSKEIENDQFDVVTSCMDNHDVPHTPSKRSKRTTKKRERTSPNKNKAYKFDANKSDEEKLGPNINFKTKPRKAAKKKLVLPIQEEEEGGIETNVNSDRKNDEKIKAHCESNNTKLVVNNVEKPSARALLINNRDKTNKLDEQLLAKKQQSTSALKDSIKSKLKLGDLQQTLLKIHQQKKKRQESEKVRKHNERMEERVKELNKKPVSNAPNEREFSYEKLHSRAQLIPDGLMLPFKFKTLYEMFTSTDTVVSMLFNRQQTTTWEMLQKSVQKMTRKNYDRKHLTQIKFVFPEAYLYRQEKGIISYNNEIRPSHYQLTLEPVLNTEESRAFGDNVKKLTSDMLVRRRHHFQVQLLNIAKEHHKTFLASLQPPAEVASDKIFRWHSQFALDKVPDIPQAELPKSPLEQQERCTTAKDVLAKARYKLTEKTVEALKKIAERVTPEKTKNSPLIIEANNNTPSPKSVKTDRALFGVSKSLLEKIKAKEAQAKVLAMTRSDESLEKIDRLRKLPDVARSIRMLFVTEKKSALPYNLVCERLHRTSGISSPVDDQENLDLLVQEMPTWISITKVRKVEYLKLNRSKEMSAILQDIESKIKTAEKC